MTNIERVEPKIVEGIEFYVSNDGSKSGVSQIGLARLCGISEASVRELLRKISTSSVRGTGGEKIVEDLSNKEIHFEVTSNQQAKVVASEVAARIITYYAFESKNPTDTAKYSLGKFAAIGFDRWVKDVTGFAENSNTEALLLTMSSTLGVLVSEVQEMKLKLEQTEGYRMARVEFKGLREWLENIPIEQYNQLQLEGDRTEELFTLNEWAELSQDGLILSRSQKHALANIVSSTFKAMALTMPPKVVRKNPKTGYDAPPVQAYSRRHFVLIDMCFAKLVTKN